MIAVRGPFTALVLAGSRGPKDPVAIIAGRQHKAFVPVAGVPMLLRVVRSLSQSPMIGRIAISLGDPQEITALPELASLVAEREIPVVASAASPSASVLRAVEALSSPFPLLVTTADHPLLTPRMIEHFCAGLPSEADLAVAVARASVVRRDYPTAVRTYFRFDEDGFSGCNLFALRAPAAAQGVRFWSRMELYRKRPWRIVALFGVPTLARFLLGRLRLDEAMQRLSDATGVTIRAVELPFAEAAIDVDKPSDLALAEAILRSRA